MGIRAGTGNYQGLSSIYEHFPKTKPHKQGRIENYQEFRYAYVGVTFGVRCNLDTLDCPPNRQHRQIPRGLFLFLQFNYITKKDCFLSFSDKFAVFFIWSVFLQPHFFVYLFHFFGQTASDSVDPHRDMPSQFLRGQVRPVRQQLGGIAGDKAVGIGGSLNTISHPVSGCKGKAFTRSR